ECPNRRCEALKIDLAGRQRWPLCIRCDRLHPIERQSCRQRFKSTGTVLVWTRQGMNLALWRCEHGIFSRGSEICDRRWAPHQDKLTKFRSEERRVGKECRDRVWASYLNIQGKGLAQDGVRGVRNVGS